MEVQDIVTIIANVAERAETLKTWSCQNKPDKAEKVISDSSRSQSDVERAKVL